MTDWLPELGNVSTNWLVCLYWWWLTKWSGAAAIFTFHPQSVSLSVCFTRCCQTVDCGLSGPPPARLSRHAEPARAPGWAELSGARTVELLENTELCGPPRLRQDLHTTCGGSSGRPKETPPVSSPLSSPEQSSAYSLHLITCLSFLLII